MAILERLKLAAAILIVAAAPAGSAFAEGEAPDPLQLDIPVRSASGPQAAGHFVIGGLLPPVGNGQGEPEPVNSLPQGFMEGTAAMEHRDALRAHWAYQANHEAQAAATAPLPNG